VKSYHESSQGSTGLRLIRLGARAVALLPQSKCIAPGVWETIPGILHAERWSANHAAVGGDAFLLVLCGPNGEPIGPLQFYAAGWSRLKDRGDLPLDAAGRLAAVWGSE
jgi:hypothetical protein